MERPEKKILPMFLLLKVYYTNCRSLRKKIDLLRGKVCVENFDIIPVTETWIDINSKKFLSEFKIEGYELIHEDRKGRREEGKGAIATWEG